MVFWLKKLVGGMLMPLPLGALAVVAGLVLGRWERHRASGTRLALVGIALIWLSGLPLTSHLLVAPLEAGMLAFEDDGSQIDALVVLGAGYRPAAKRPLTGVLSSEAVVRVAEASRLMRRLPQVPLHCTGWGGGRPGSNAQAACDLAVELGVEATRVHVHPTPRDTAEEAEAIAAAVGVGRGDGQRPHVVIVTDATHMRRARFLFEHAGMRVSVAPTGHIISESPSLWLLPSAGALYKTSRALHEWLGLAWARVTAWRQGPGSTPMPAPAPEPR